MVGLVAVPSAALGDKGEAIALHVCVCVSEQLEVSRHSPRPEVAKFLDERRERCGARPHSRAGSPCAATSHGPFRPGRRKP